MSKIAESKHIEQKDNCACGWGAIYSHRFGIENFPCLHMVNNCKITYKNLTIPIAQNPNTQVEVLKSIENWNFSISNEENLHFQVKKNDLEFEYFLRENTEYDYLCQTAKEISEINGYKLNFQEILSEISKYWGAETKDLNNEIIQDVTFRATFRLKMYQKYIKVYEE